MMRVETAERSCSRPTSFLRQSMASTRKGSSSRRARSASVKVKSRCSGSGDSSCSWSSSSSAIWRPFSWAGAKEMRLSSPMLTQTKHAVEGHARVMACAFIDANSINNVASRKIFKRPQKMLRRDAEHRGANANTWIERNNFAVAQFFAEAIDEMDFRADSPFCSRGRFADGFDDAFGGTNLIGGLRNFEAALGMHDHADAGMLATDALDVLRREALMDRTVA